MFEIKGITKHYSWRGKPAIDRISIQLNPSEVVGLVGLNGAGKTTTLRVASGVSLANKGEVVVDGISMRSQKERASRLLGWVPEQPIHDSASRVSSLVRYYSDIAGGISYSHGERLLATWGMESHLRKRFRELSLGYKRRLAVVIASLTSPKYFLLDEPFNGLDPAAMVQFRTWIREARAGGAGIILSSHNLREVQDLADRVIVIHRGRLIAWLESQSLLELSHKEVTVVVDRLDDGARGILQKFGEVSAHDTTVLIRGQNVDPGAVSAALFRGGYTVLRLTTGENGLEEYFLELVNGAS